MGSNFSNRTALKCRLVGCPAIKGQERIRLEERFAAVALTEGGNNIFRIYETGKGDPFSKWAEIHASGVREAVVHADSDNSVRSLEYARFEIGGV